MAALLRKRYEQGESMTRLAAATGSSSRTIHRLLGEAGVEFQPSTSWPAWTPQELKQLRELDRRGWTTRRIARKLGRTYLATEAKRRQLKKGPFP
jgi:hypothetical protein